MGDSKMITARRTAVCLLAVCVASLVVAGFTGCSPLKKLRGEPAEFQVDLLPGMELPECIGGKCRQRQVNCPPGTFHVTQWRPLDPPVVAALPCSTCVDSCVDSTSGPVMSPGWNDSPTEAVPEGPEEIPLPPATPLEMELPPPEGPGPLGLPDVSDQPRPGNGSLSGNGPRPANAVVQTDAQLPVESRTELNQSKSGRISEPSLQSDVDLVDLILAEDIEPWSGRIVSDSE